MQTRYINTASTAGGDGTTNATSGANRAYASFAEWEAARQASLTEVEEVICILREACWVYRSATAFCISCDLISVID